MTICKETNCKIRASYGNFTKKSIYCLIHKSLDMFNVVSKTCLHENCTTRPTFGIEKGKATHCSSHKINEMFNVKDKTCLYENCTTRPNFGIEKGKATHCFKHKINTMFDVISKTCLQENCKKQPTFGLNEKQPTHCLTHKTNEMFDVINLKCTSCGLFQVKKINKYLCSYCNPNKQEKTKRKEIIIKELLEKQNLTFTHDKQISNDCCIKYRTDFLFDCKNYFIILEVDENAHNGYPKECEIIRMNNLASGLGLPTLFIRYNPDKTGIKQKEKHFELLNTLKANLNFPLLVYPTPIYLFY